MTRSVAVGTPESYSIVIVIIIAIVTVIINALLPDASRLARQRATPSTPSTLQMSLTLSTKVVSF